MLNNYEHVVTVIVPVYNVEKFLPKCIESICNQSYTNLQIILVDDGSKDSSGSICDKYAYQDDRIEVIHKKNAGVSSARNSGIDASLGDYICFVDGDDYVMPDYVSYLLRLLVDNKADISLTTKMFGNFDQEQVKADNIQHWSSEDAVEAILCYRVPIGCYCKLFKKEALAKVRFIPEVFIGEGFNFNISAFQHSHKIIAGQRKIYYYRRNNPTSAMTSFSIKKVECGLNALNIIKKNLTFNSKRIQKAWNFANWRTHSDFYDMFILAKTENQYPDIFEECKYVTRRDAFSALSVPTTRQNKIRACVMKVWPSLIPFAMKYRARNVQGALGNKG